MNFSKEFENRCAKIIAKNEIWEISGKGVNVFRYMTYDIKILLYNFGHNANLAKKRNFLKNVQ